MPSKVIEQRPLDEEYAKTGVSPSDIAALRQWLKTQPHLPDKYITDLELILAYYSCYKSSEVSKQVIDLHYTLRTLFTNLFHNRLVDDNFIRTMNVILGFPIETRTSKDYKVIYFRLIDYDAKNFVFSEAVRAAIMLIDLMQYEDGAWKGFVILIDLNRVTLSHIARLDLQTIQQLLYYLQEAMLVRLKGLHFLNAPSFIDRLMMLLRPFMKKELMDMLKIHQVGATTLEDTIPIDALPREAGGKSNTFEEIKNEMIEKLIANKDFFVEENKRRVTESLRPGKPKTITDIFGGIEGSFKKLDID
ncbi:unnamed protein product [Danaus chrysippus]|uniref:(African queen) hypothetical protein n=1 Tax=Danaus chrysippus TaxID=151541 RepID=A0A8J2VY66_9NEOP|nr:unnamed protein product [Danaus chrysippus]